MNRFCILCALLLLWAAPALAAPDTPYAPETVLRTAPLSPEAETLLDTLYVAAVRCETEPVLPEGARYDDVNAAVRSLTSDYPELFHLAREWRIGYAQARPEIAVSLTLGYSLTPESYAEEAERLLACARVLADGGDVDRAETLHDWLCERVDYAVDTSPGGHSTAADALLLGSARCEGYAQAFSLLCRMNGIPCGMVVGTAGDASGQAARHAWNIATLDGQATLIDATWDDQGDVNTHWYFGLTDEMMAADHAPDPSSALPACTSLAANWQARRGLLIGDEEGLLTALELLSREGEVSLRFLDEALYAAFAADPEGWLRRLNAMRPEAAFEGAYSVMLGGTQPCALLRRE